MRAMRTLNLKNENNKGDFNEYIKEIGGIVLFGGFGGLFLDFWITVPKTMREYPIMSVVLTVFPLILCIVLLVSFISSIRDKK